MSNFLSFKRKIFLFLIGILFLLNVFAWKEIFISEDPRYLKVDVLDVGQGDSISIETPERRHILIDGGPNSSVLQKLAKLLPFWDKHLDVVILTHPDADHVMGLIYVLQKYKVDYIVWTGIVRDGGNYQKWISLLEKQKKQGAKTIITKLNQQIKNGNILIETLHPFEDLTGKFFSKQDNDTGIVSRMTFGKNSFLFTADISNLAEKK